MKSEKVLLVDDEQEILDTLKRLHKREFKIDIALEATKGLEAVATQGPYAVIVSDMRMPGMDGIQFLSKVKKIAPDSVRIMLTGNADMDTAVDAVNEGNIFRFLTKPCSPEKFSKTLEAGIEQYHLVIAERELLEKTLSRSIKVLIDILSMVNPAAFSRAARIRTYVKHVSSKFKLKNAWKYELAAMLSQLGCVTLPPDIIDKYYSGQSLSKDEQKMLASHPSVGRELLERIPRLESIALMIEKQEKPFSEYQTSLPPEKRNEVDIGAQMIKAAIDFDKLVSRGDKFESVSETLLGKPDECDREIVLAIRSIEVKTSRKASRMIKIADLSEGMTLDEDIIANNKLLVAPKGIEITYPLSWKLKNFWRNGLISGQVRILLHEYE